LMEDDARFGQCQFALSPELEPVVGHWSNYPMTMSRRLAANFNSPAGPGSGGCELSGVDVAFGCDLPVAGGLSGSSALMILTFFAIALPNRLTESPLFRANIKDGLDLAMYLACAENGQTFRGLTGRAGVGTFGGSEDHTQILNARPGRLSLYQFCPTRFEEEIDFPQDLSLIIAHSGIEAVKTGAAMEQYNRASRRAQAAVATYNRGFASNHQLLRDLADERGLNVTLSALAASPQTPDLDLPGRFRQFYEEDRRLIPAAAAALKARDYTRFGQIVDESHALSRVYLQNIIPEIDALQRSARALGAVAASGFGAGFGGSAYAIVAKDSEERFARAWRQAYLCEFPQCTGACHFFSAAVTGQAGELFV
jgi:galactokinase